MSSLVIVSEKCCAKEVVVKKWYEVPSHVFTVHGKVLARVPRPCPIWSEGVAEGILGPLQFMRCDESPPGGLGGGQEVASVEGRGDPCCRIPGTSRQKTGPAPKPGEVIERALPDSVRPWEKGCRRTAAGRPCNG